MKIRVQLVVELGDERIIEDIICFERGKLSPETMGLTLKESKAMNAGVQKATIVHQIEEFASYHRFCSCCGAKRTVRGYHPLMYRTLFGKVCLRSPRFLTCQCQPQRYSSFSPLSRLLSERLSPELRYLESKWASLMPYGVTARLLEEVFPLEVHPSSVRSNTQNVSTRLEAESGEENGSFAEGCPQVWDRLPRPSIPITVSLDGGYVHARDGHNRKAGWFEVIVGKSSQEGLGSKRFGYVTNYEKKPQQKLYEMLKNQGLQMNQGLTFLTDGGDTVRNLPLYLSPRSEHILDWFHVTMRITTLKQMSKTPMKQDYPAFEKKLDRIKRFLWHGNTFKSLDLLESLTFELDLFSANKEHKKYKLRRTVYEFSEYIRSNSHFVPNYGERYRHGEPISSAPAESTVNEVISRRMAKKQQMRWTQKGAHLLLQVRIKTLNNDLRKSFHRWYPQMDQDNDSDVSLAA